MEDTDLHHEAQLRSLASSFLVVSAIWLSTSLLSWAMGVHPWALIGSATSVVETIRRARKAVRRHEEVLSQGLAALAFFAALGALLWACSH